MKKHIFYLISIAIFLSLGCSTQKGNQSRQTSAIKPSSTSQNVSNNCALFNMGLIDYEIIDPAATSEETAKKIVERMSPQLKYDVIYDSKRIVTLRYNSNGTINNKALYNYSDGNLYEFRYGKQTNYYCKTSNHITTEAEEENPYFKKIFRKNPGADKTIFGYPCSQVTVMDPIVNGKVLAEVYIAESIHYINKGFGQIGSVLTGLPLELTMTVQGVKLRTGALNLTYNDSYCEFLEPKFDEFQEMDPESFRLLEESFSNDN